MVLVCRARLVLLWVVSVISQLLGHVSPNLSQLGRQLTEPQLDNKLNSCFRFTNIRHVKSNLSQLTDDHSVTRVLIS